MLLILRKKGLVIQAHNLVQNELSTGNVKDNFKTRTYFTISRFAVVILNRRHR